MYNDPSYQQENESGLAKLNIADKISDATNKLIKQLSGKEHRGKKKVIDNIISFIGASGGTGTSTIVANVAQNLVDKNFSVLVIDANICYPAQHIFFRVKQEINKKDLVSFLTGKNTIGESIEYRGELGVLVSNNRNLRDYIHCDSKIVSQNIADCLDRVASLFDLVLIDCPNNISHDLVNTILYKSDAIYCVWDEGISCVANFERLRINLRLLGIDVNKIRVILNKKTNIYYRESVFKSLKAELVEVLPFDTAIIESGLMAEVFIKKGESTSKNAKEFVKGINRLTNKLVQLGGYDNGR